VQRSEAVDAAKRRWGPQASVSCGAFGGAGKRRKAWAFVWTGYSGIYGESGGSRGRGVVMTEGYPIASAMENAIFHEKRHAQQAERAAFAELNQAAEKGQP